MYSFFIIYLIFSYIFYVGYSLNRHEFADDFENTQIIITTSAVKNANKFSEFRIHWNHPNFIEGDSLAFYERDPRVEENVPIIFYHPLRCSNGFVKTGIKVSENQISCYHAAILRRGKIEKTCNISPKLNWMGERKSSLGPFIIPQLFIPGTHGSGNYPRPSDNIFGVKIHTLKWTQNQDHSIKRQLEHGIRYLDIRPAWNKKKNIYNVNHAGVVMIPMSDVVNEIDEFLNKTNEIVILSFKEFPQGFSNRENHEKFSLYIEKSLSRHLQPYNPHRGWGVPLEYFWNSNKRLIVTYDNNSYRHPKFWPAIPQYWGDCRTINCLHSFLQSFHTARPRYPLQSSPYAAMAELTHNTTTGIHDALLLSRNSSLRKWADEIGSLIPKWYNEQWNSTANIVAVDYFLSSGVVDLAIYWNERRANIHR